MRLKSLIIIGLSIAMLGLSNHADAQKNKYKKRRQTNRKISHYKGGVTGYGRFEPYIYVGAAINAGNYFGDLAPVSKAASTDFSFTRPGFGIYGGYKFHHSLAVRAGFNWVRVTGDDFSAESSGENLYRYARNLSFRNDIKEFQVGLEVYLLPNYGGPNQRLPINAYLFVGGAVFHHEPKGKVPEFDYQLEGINATTPAPNAGEWVKLRPLGTEGQNQGLNEPYKNIAFSIPVSVGAHMRLPGTQLTAGIEFGIRYLFTDYIDDVSTTYADLANFTDPLARIMSDRSSEPFSSRGDTRNINQLGIQQVNGFFKETAVGLGSGTDGSKRGNPDSDDMIFMTQLKLSYVIGGTTRRRAKYR